MQQKKFINFKRKIWQYYKKHKRTMPWRGISDPYKIFISEIMLQQTQVDRVIPKYFSFIKSFPTIQSLARAPLKDIVREWQGLGYNRRALYLKQCAQGIVKNYHGVFPRDRESLCKLSGIGKATAGAILAYAFNKPVVYIETNVREVFIHFFFKNRDKLTDVQIEPLVLKTLDQKNPREWYYALMDYGAMLKKEGKQANALSAVGEKSTHYVKQTRFKGSDREIRGKIVRHLALDSASFSLIQEKTGESDTIRLKRVISLLEKEGLLEFRKGLYSIAG